MKKLTKGERTGVIALGIITLLIAGGGFLLRSRCTVASLPNAPVVLVRDTISDAANDVLPDSANQQRKSAKKKSKKGSRKSVKSIASSPERDMLGDPIPTK